MIFPSHLLSHPAYEDAFALARALSERMLERLDFFALQPSVILEAGADRGFCAGLLATRFPNARIIALETSVNDTLLTLPDNSVDMVIANLMLPWCKEWEAQFAQWRRVLRPEGLLMLTAFGPDTLHELSQEDVGILERVDMHMIGDRLVKAGFSGPVLDVDMMALTYGDSDRLWEELQLSSMLKPSADKANLPNKNARGRYQLTYEVIHAHAWNAIKQTGQLPDETGTVKISLLDLKKQLEGSTKLS